MLYMIFYILTFLLFSIFTFFSISENKYLKNNYLFFYISIYIFIITIPIYFYNFESVILSTIFSVICFYFTSILTYYVYKHKKYYAILLLPFNFFNYYTFCYLLALSLNL